MKTPKLQNPKSKEHSSSKPCACEQRLDSSMDRGGHPADEVMELRDAPVREPGTRPFDLEERTAQFGEAIVRFSRQVPRDPTNKRLIEQLVGAGTSVGANYAEASESVSKKDFRFSISRCVKEAKETRFFLRMIAASEPSLADEARKLYREAKELMLIFANIYRK